MSEDRLMLEVLSGPFDGAMIALEANAEWTQASEGPLAFPWDIELGQPQARFFVEEGGWYLEGLTAPHGTYRVNREQRLGAGEKAQLERGDVLKASDTWLLVQKASV